MKKSFLLMGALCVGTAFVSCVDDSESNEVKELRQVQLDSKKADLDNQYWTMYNNAVAKVKSYRDDLKTAQENLDAAKDEKTTLTEVKEAYIAYQQQVIARNEKDIADKKAEIEVQKAMAGKTYEEIQKAKIEAANAKEKANKDAADYWIKKTNDGYNQSYDKYDNDGDSSTDEMTADLDDAIDMLLGDYSTLGLTNVAYRNNKLSKNEWVMAMNKILNEDGYVYTDGYGLSQTSYDYTFTFSYDPGDDFNHVTSYDAMDMIKDQQLALYSDNGFVYQYYTKYTYKDLAKYKSALSKYLNNDESGKEGLEQQATSAKDYYGENSDTYKDAVTALNKYKALKAKINELDAVLNDAEKYAAYTSLLDEYIGYAKEINALNDACTKANAIATAYAAYITNGTVSNNESTIATLEDAINTYNANIKAAKKEINEVINNGLTDKETAIAYYNARIAEINSALAANQAIAEKYRALIAGSSSSNNQQQQQTPAPEETPAE